MPPNDIAPPPHAPVVNRRMVDGWYVRASPDRRAHMIGPFDYLEDALTKHPYWISYCRVERHSLVVVSTRANAAIAAGPG